ncbi:MAG: L,D-transpeptidase, partial [Hyphomicrobiales bacterium]
MRNFSSILLFLLGIFSTASHAEEDLYTKKIVAHVDLTNQRMHVTIEGLSAHTWKISSGRSGYLTPTGTYQPKFLHRMHYSRQYDNSPMPHSVFFFRGYAVHGTSYVQRLGRPASHGCIRLAKPHARKFFDLVKAFGKS